MGFLIRWTSFLNNEDLLGLTSSFNSSFEDFVNCNKCLNKYVERVDYSKKADKYDELLMKARKNKGCFDYETKRFEVEHLAYYTCPGNLRSPSFKSIWVIYQQYKKGIMPFPGTFLEQPAKIIDWFDALDNLHGKWQSEQDKKAQLRQKDHNRR